MPSPIKSMIQAGSTLWLDSVDPEELAKYEPMGITGATSNPKIVHDLIDTGRFDERLSKLIAKGIEDEALAWMLTDHLVREAQERFLPVWEKTKGDDGYVSFELDPLLEDPDLKLTDADRTQRYIDLGKEWSSGHKNRMIKVPATPGGIGALEELAAQGVCLNVTLIFTQHQYEQARDAIWRGAQNRKSLDGFKSVYSIFISRVDVYTHKNIPELSAAQGLVGIVNAKRTWRANEAFWADKKTPLRQQIVFASTGVKNEGDPPDKYVCLLVGDDIQTNPPELMDAIEESGKAYHKTIDQMQPQAVIDEIDAKIDMRQVERELLREGIAKFADPQKKLLKLIGQRREQLAKGPKS